MRGEGGPLPALKGPPSPLKLPPSFPNALYQGEAGKHGIAVLPRLSFFCHRDIYFPAIPAALPSFLPANRACRTSDPPILLGSSLSVFPASDILTFSHLLPLC